MGAFVKFDGAAGLADTEEVVAWLAKNRSSVTTDLGSPPPPASPDNDSGDEDGRETVAAEATGAALTIQRIPANGEVERESKPMRTSGPRLSIKDQEELMAKIEADPDNMDLLMQLQEVHRSLSAVRSPHAHVLCDGTIL